MPAITLPTKFDNRSARKGRSEMARCRGSTVTSSASLQKCAKHAGTCVCQMRETALQRPQPLIYTCLAGVDLLTATHQTADLSPIVVAAHSRKQELRLSCQIIDAPRQKMQMSHSVNLKISLVSRSDNLPKTVLATH